MAQAPSVAVFRIYDIVVRRAFVLPFTVATLGRIVEGAREDYETETQTVQS